MDYLYLCSPLSVDAYVEFFKSLTNLVFGTDTSIEHKNWAYHWIHQSHELNINSNIQFRSEGRIYDKLPFHDMLVCCLDDGPKWKGTGNFYLLFNIIYFCSHHSIDHTLSVFIETVLHHIGSIYCYCCDWQKNKTFFMWKTFPKSLICRLHLILHSSYGDGYSQTSKIWHH